jgi:hypothetical protein
MRVDFPATKGEILVRAKHQGAPEDMLRQLERLPEYMYGSVNTVMEALRPAA